LLTQNSLVSALPAPHPCAFPAALSAAVFIYKKFLTAKSNKSKKEGEKVAFISENLFDFFDSGEIFLELRIAEFCPAVLR
jgi:hypothetical protein